MKMKKKSLTDAVLAVLTGDESPVADAVVADVGVDARAVGTDALLFALVGFAAFVGLFVALHSGRTFAFERTDRVEALASLAQGRNGFALVDVCSSMHHY